MQSIDIHLTEMAGWRAVLSKAQFLARTEFDPLIEEYLIGLLFRTLKTSSFGESNSPMQSFQVHDDNPFADFDDFRSIGDHCLLYAGLFPEQAILRNLPISYFARVGRLAYAESARLEDDPIFEMLATSFVEIMDVLLVLREIEHEAKSMDLMSAYHLWRDTGSARAWRTLISQTASLPNPQLSAAIN
ncbi:MAG: hypothetical protein ACI9BW_001096 [Gammaproteobacteria bacterium]|jgi:hypothetical protein